MKTFKLFRRQVYDPPLTRRQIITSLVLAILVGGALSTLVGYACLVLGGAGHGVNDPVYFFFPPIFGYWGLQYRFGGYDETLFARYMDLTILIMFGYYSIYGLALSLGRIWGCGKSVLVLVLLFHYTGFLICVVWSTWDDVRTMRLVAQGCGVLLMVFMVELFFALHVLAVQYACSPLPYRVRWTRSAIAVLVSGLVVGVALLIYMMPGVS